MINGKKTILRAIEPSDTESYFGWINDDDTNVLRGLHHPKSKSQSQSWLLGETDTASDRLTLAIDFITDDNKLCFTGLIGLRGICSRSRRAEIWIYIGAKQHWGRGIGTDAICSMCKYAFEQMNLHRIWLECDHDHIGAIKCYEKVGFSREGLLKDGYYKHGQYRDTIIMGLTRPNWDSKK